MAGQDVGFFNVNEDCPDLVIENGDLKADNGLETAALISLFSDRRVTFEQLPAGHDNRRGWWADLIADVENDQIGSRLWQLEAEGKILSFTSAELENIFSECFEWLIDDGIATRVEVSADRIDTNEIAGSALIYRPKGDDIPFKFIWDGQRLRLNEG